MARAPAWPASSSRCRCRRAYISDQSAARAAVADGLAVDARHGQHAAAGRGDPHFLAALESRAPRRRRSRWAASPARGRAIASREVPGRMWWLFGGVDEHAAAHEEHAARGAFEQQAVAHEQRLVRAAVCRLLPQQHVAEQRDRLDVAAVPANVLERHGRKPLLEGRRGGLGIRAREGEHGRRAVVREQVVARRIPRRASPAGRRGAPARPRVRGQPPEHRGPPGVVERVCHPDAAQAVGRAASGARAAGTAGRDAPEPLRRRRPRTGIRGRAARRARPRAAGNSPFR